MSQTFGNNAVTTLTADQPLSGIGSDVLQVANGGAPFPNTGQTFTVRVDGELELVTGGFGTNVLNVTRAQEATAAALHTTGASVKQEITLAGMLSLGDGFWPALRPSGLTGAVLPARFVGGSSGPPTSGTFAVGDYTVDALAGVMWVCNIAGSPGVFLAVGGAPTGSVTDFAGATAPAGWLLCNGSAVSRSTFAQLFTVVGTVYGAGDGSTTFNVPDTRGRATQGVGALNTNAQPTITLGQVGGEAAHTLTQSENGQHNHYGFTFGESGHHHNVFNRENLGGGGAGYGIFSNAQNSPTSGSTGHFHGIPNDPGPPTTAHNTMTPFIGFTKIIKT